MTQTMKGALFAVVIAIVLVGLWYATKNNIFVFSFPKLT
jgi:hypothetical protein